MNLQLIQRFYDLNACGHFTLFETIKLIPLKYKKAFNMYLPFQKKMATYIFTRALLAWGISENHRNIIIKSNLS